MNTKVTLKSLFESQQSQLEEQLANLRLPEDTQKVQSIVSDYLNKLLEDEGDFRQNLTQSEDYILQATLSLLNAQQAMIREFQKTSYSTNKFHFCDDNIRQNLYKNSKGYSNLQ